MHKIEQLEQLVLPQEQTIKTKGITKKNSTSNLTRKFSIGHKIGEGHSCVVKIATTKTGKTLAAKIITFSSSQGSRESFRREVEALLSIKHSNVILMYDHLCSDQEGIIFLELLLHVPLSDYMSAMGPFSECQALPLFQQLTAALACVHRCFFAHNDIKPENIMFDQHTMSVKLFDFGLALRVDPNESMVAFHGGSPLYMAPEVLDPTHDLFMSDIWALGITFYEMVEGEAPLSYCADLDELVSCLHLGSTYFTYPDYLSDNMVCLLRGMLHNDVSFRLQLDQVETKLIRLLNSVDCDNKSHSDSSSSASTATATATAAAVAVEGFQQSGRTLQRNCNDNCSNYTCKCNAVSTIENLGDCELGGERGKLMLV